MTYSSPQSVKRRRALLSIANAIRYANSFMAEMRKP